MLENEDGSVDDSEEEESDDDYSDILNDDDNEENSEVDEEKEERFKEINSNDEKTAEMIAKAKQEIPYVIEGMFD